MLPGETIRSGANKKCDCGVTFVFEPLRSNAGWYVGTMCKNKNCDHYLEPNSRESDYYISEGEVKEAMEKDKVKWRT